MLDNTIPPPTSVLSSIDLMSQPTVPMQRESFAGEYVRAPQERGRSPLAVGWVGSVKSLLVNQGNVKPNMTRWGDRIKLKDKMRSRATNWDSSHSHTSNTLMLFHSPRIIPAIALLNQLVYRSICGWKCTAISSFCSRCRMTDILIQRKLTVPRMNRERNSNAICILFPQANKWSSLRYQVYIFDITNPLPLL